jgi:type IV pilus assembly protein PilP
MKPQFIKTAFVFLVIGLISGCQRDMSDLEEFVESVKNRPPRPIEPLPEIKPQETFEYSAFGLRDPFSNDLQQTETVAVEENNVEGEGPDLNRRKEMLESYPLDSLAMVGTYAQGDNYWALIVDPEGTIYRVSVGDHMGQNYGEVTAISEDEVKLLEWQRDGLGGWIQREATIALSEEE